MFCCKESLYSEVDIRKLTQCFHFSSYVPSGEPGPVSEELLKQVAELPDEWDWDNVGGIDYVPPVR